MGMRERNEMVHSHHHQPARVPSMVQSALTDRSAQMSAAHVSVRHIHHDTYSSSVERRFEKVWVEPKEVWTRSAKPVRPINSGTAARIVEIINSKRAVRQIVEGPITLDRLIADAKEQGYTEIYHVYRYRDESRLGPDRLPEATLHAQNADEAVRKLIAIAATTRRKRSSSGWTSSTPAPSWSCATG